VLVGAFVADFKIDIWTSFLINIVPILIYLFVCLVCKEKIQVRYFYSSGIPWEVFINGIFYKSTLGQILKHTAVLLNKFIQQRKSLKV